MFSSISLRRIELAGNPLLHFSESTSAACSLDSPLLQPISFVKLGFQNQKSLGGELPAVLRAVVEIGCQLRDNPTKQVISVNPTNNTAFRCQLQHYVDPNSGSYVNLDVMVPENLVGGLIGRSGANISRIRNESGANIKVYGARGEQTQRQIHLGGNAQ
ncbi:Unknown protein [Striga hermonthica]|uniref:K Homology domain-containing protein n=1 Tax=Striga hermonthica TaxID=68872 RepID=A0A9N7N8R7_STRHE|nr:Unknown protein [Striga hermonthica]